MSLLSQMVHSAFTAFVVWLSVVGVLFSSLCAYRMSTKEYYVKEYERAYDIAKQQRIQYVHEMQISIRKQRYERKVAYEEAKERHLRAIEEAKINAEKRRQLIEERKKELNDVDFSRHESTLDELINDYQRKDASNKILIRQLEEQIKQVQEYSENIKSMQLPSSSSDDDDVNVDDDDQKQQQNENNIPVKQLMKAFQMERMDYFSDHDLEHVLGGALRELESYVANSSTVDWNPLYNIAEYKHFPRKQPSTVTWKCNANNNSIVKPIKKRKQRKLQIPSHAARIDDLANRIEVIDETIRQRSHIIHGKTDQEHEENMKLLLQPDSMKTVSREFSTRTRSVFTHIISVAERLKQNDASLAKEIENKPKASCHTEELVTELLDEGLLAIRTKADLRNVIRKKLMEIDTSEDTSSIILDADLPMTLPHQIMDDETMNLRRIIDTPMLTKATDWIDMIIEATGGYADSWDQFVDSYASSRESIGEKIINNILYQSSTIDIPTRKKLWNSLPRDVKRFLFKQRIVR